MKKLGGNLRTTEFLKECLADALIKLLKEKPIEKITIPEIAKLSGVGRTTYFRNFSSKNEMLTFKLVQLWRRWAEGHELIERNNFSLNNALSFFQCPSAIFLNPEISLLRCPFASVSIP